MDAGTAQATSDVPPDKQNTLPHWLTDMRTSLAARQRSKKTFLPRYDEYCELVRFGLIAAPPERPPPGSNEATRFLRQLALAGRRSHGGLTVLFDPHWYLLKNPDVATAHINPAIHFVRHGAMEGRDPSPLFWAAWYAQRNPDVEKSGMSPFAHYREIGARSNLNPHPLFHAAWYNETHSDVAASGLTALEHFLTVGWKREFDPNPWFNIHWYLERYGASLIHPNPVIDYLLGGAAKGRDPSERFSTDFYVSEYDDVLEAKLNPLTHFLAYGLEEGRAALPLSRYRRVTAAPQKPAQRSARMKPPPRPTVELRTLKIPAESRVNALAPRISVNWVVMPDNHGWAYGNNAKRLSAALAGFDHQFDRQSPGDDIALYFDIRIFKKVGKLGRANVLRVGGRRPLDIQYGDNWEDLAKDLQNFDAVIALNSELQQLVAPLHRNVSVIPNGIDSVSWCPAPNCYRENRQFTVGFAGNLTTGREREVKGFSFAAAACKKLGVPLITLQKIKQQIAHEDMPRDFYGKIDCLVHPVGEGKEGCSNVIMEALALGIPVITTRHCGFHSEHLIDGETVLYCERDVDDVAEKIAGLIRNPELAAAISRAGRRFAEKHHAIGRIADAYRQVLKDVAVRRFGIRACFVPFWSPSEQFASSRLRCLQPALQLKSSASISASLGYDASADVVVISQLASDETLAAILQQPDQFVIYDICDRYHVDDRTIGGVHAAIRFRELVARADVVVASTLALRMELSEFLPGKPVLHVPDGIDYGGTINPVASPPGGPIVWFGNPGRGNFESVRGLLDVARAELGREVKLISRKRSFANDQAYSALCVEWNPETFVDELRAGSVCVVTHAEHEPLKSPNRLVTAAANGVPTIVYNSPACEAVLEEANCAEAILASESELPAALIRFSDPQVRADYLRKLQDHIAVQFGPDRMRQRYERLFIDCTWSKQSRSALRVLFVSHNLQFGEGAPMSLFQTIVGLKTMFGIEAAVYSPLDGDLREKYEENGIPVWLSSTARKSRTVVGAVGKSYTREFEEFSGLLSDKEIEIVCCNTAKTLFYAQAAERLGIPAVTVVRESSEEHLNFSFATGEMMRDSAEALRSIRGLIFVSELTRQLWRERNVLAPSSVIPNGIAVQHWEPLLHRPVAEVREELGLDPAELIILCVGTITPRKGQADLVRAFSELTEEERHRARIVLVGARPSRYLEDLLAHIEGLAPGMARQITIVAETSQIGPWYRAADIFVLASYNESYPRVIVEAMFFGLPVISTAVFGAKEQVLDGANGFLFEPGDVARLSEHLAELLSDESMRKRMAKRSQRRFWELCTFEEMVIRYGSLFFNLTRERIEPDKEHGRPVRV